jgi:hypothetical protein
LLKIVFGQYEVNYVQNRMVWPSCGTRISLMDGPGAGLLAVALWVAALLGIALVIRSSLRRDDRPFRRRRSDSSQEAQESGEAAEVASYAEAEESRELGEPSPVKRPSRNQKGRQVKRAYTEAEGASYRESRRRTYSRAGSLDAQIAALASGSDDDLERLIHSVRASRPASSRRREPVRRWTAENSVSNGASKVSEPAGEGLRSTAGITYVVVDEEGRPESN